MKANVRNVVVSVMTGSTIAFFPYFLDALIPPDPKHWMWIPPWDWLRLPGDLIAGGGATPNMVVVNTINAALYSGAAYPCIWWWTRLKSRRKRAL